MKADCHIHMVLDGADWRSAIARYRQGPDESWVRHILARYQNLGFSYLRDGGDKWNVGALARTLAPEYGITYRTPLAPLHRTGHYGGFIGTGYDDLRQYTDLVRQGRTQGRDFIKIMISGLMDFDHYGILSEDGLPPDEIRELIHIAHEEGFAVMAHANGARTVEAAASAGADSIEHGAYLDEAALAAMVENHCIWCPTLSTIGNLLGKGRFQEAAVREILDSAADHLRRFAHLGGLIASGSDAGAWAVAHGCETEDALLSGVLGPDASEILARGTNALISRF